MRQEVFTASAAETMAFGAELASSVEPGTVLCFFGELGAGKTTLIKGFVGAATEFSVDDVSSPTFTYLNIYEGEKPVYHFDLYRLNSSEEFMAMGFDDFFEAGGFCCVEWAERIEEVLPRKTIKVTMRHDGEDRRHILVER